MWSFFSRDPVKDFPYEIGEPISFDSNRVFWKLHKGRRKVINIFSFNSIPVVKLIYLKNSPFTFNALKPEPSRILNNASKQGHIILQSFV